MAETKKDALVAFDAFVETWGIKYDKAVECLTKDRDALLAFYDLPTMMSLSSASLRGIAFCTRPYRCPHQKFFPSVC
jgi:putative transposase